MGKANMNKIIEDLIKGFDRDLGCPEVTYFATYRLILQEWGSASASMFANIIDATDDCFYIPKCISGEDAIKQVKEAKV